MNRTPTNEKALKGASRNAQKAFDALHDKAYAHVRSEEKVAWAMAAMIHCDICRLVVAFDECEREGLARLLWMADIYSKLYEAKNWYFEKGNKLLYEIAKSKSCGGEAVKARIKELKKSVPMSKIDSYADYRNKFGYHYDPDALDYLEKFGNEEADTFFEILTTFARFSGEWASLASSLIKNELPASEAAKP